MGIKVEFTNSRVTKADKLGLEAGSSRKGATVLARSGGLIGIKAGPNNRSRIRCRKLHWGRVKGARGRGKRRDGGARKRTSNDRKRRDG